MIDIDRTEPAPASLARQTTWSDQDVLDALRRIFLGKCYLCERVLSRGEVEVEHRRPRSQWPEGTFHWPNLFPACGYCNGRRSKKAYPAVGLLCPGDQIERRLAQEAMVDHTGTSLVCQFAAVDPEDASAEVTAEELRRLHSSEHANTARARYASLDLLDAIHDHFLHEVHPLELRARRARKRGQPDDAVEAALRRALSRRAPFTMLMRSLVHPGLADLFD